MSDMEKRQNKNLDALAQQINEEHRAFFRGARKTLGHAICAGELLTQAKAECPHGTWLTWLGEHFEGTERNAQNYMRIYKNRDELEAQIDSEDTPEIRTVEDVLTAKTKRDSDLSIRGALKALSNPVESGVLERLTEEANVARKIACADAPLPKSKKTPPSESLHAPPIEVRWVFETNGLRRTLARLTPAKVAEAASSVANDEEGLDSHIEACTKIIDWYVKYRDELVARHGL